MTKFVAIVCYYLGLDALFYFLNRRAKRIITFHNVLDDELFRPGLANGVSNSLGEFRLIVGECAKRFGFSVDLFDPKTLTITFDDGYRNQYTTAFAELKKRGIPACLFVAGDLLRQGQPRPCAEEANPLLIDKLLHWVAEVPLAFVPGGDRLQYWMKEIWPSFMADHAARGGSVLAALEKQYAFEKILDVLPRDYVEERLTGLTEAELDEMRKAGWLIGWHTKSHYPLSQLSSADVREELEGPAEYRNACLSFPYGNPVEVGETAIRIAEELGYPCAVSNCNDVDENASRYFLPRLALSADKYLLHFELSGCKHFLKHRKLLADE